MEPVPGPRCWERVLDVGVAEPAGVSAGDLAQLSYFKEEQTQDSQLRVTSLVAHELLTTLSSFFLSLKPSLIV